MSDTPLTDAAKEGGESWMELAALSAVLERENAAMREELESSRRLVNALIIKADAFDYLAWLEKKRGEEAELQGADFLCLASDGTTCWGKTYLEAVRIAEQQDRIAFDSAAIDAARRKEAQP
jgi:hypothetical protein